MTYNLKAAVGSGIIPDEVAAAAISARSKPNQEAPKRGDERHAEAGDEPQEKTMNYERVVTVVALGFYVVAMGLLLYGVLTRRRSWWWYHIRFWFTFRSWPTKDARLKELQKDQFVLEKLRSYALALHNANELQAKVLDTIKRGGLKYKEAIKQLAHAEREQKRLLDRFERAQAIAKCCGFDVPAYFKDYLPEILIARDRPRASGVSSG